MPGALLAFLQFFFALTWVVYVLFLPGLAEQAGIDRKHVGMILIADQVIFLACDWAAGVYADRIARKFGRIGGWMAVVTLVSCAAFIALPFVAPAAGSVLFLFLIVLWSATSSALRAPPFAIVSRHSKATSQPWVACAYLFGLGAASALAPYIGIELRQLDPRIPFALSSIALAAFAFALARAERVGADAPVAGTSPAGRAIAIPPVPLLAFVVLLFAFGFQVHFAINSSQAYLRFSEQDQLPRLMPIFWVGFNLGLVPATFLVKRFGGSAMLVVAGAVGVGALMACTRAPSVIPLMIAQAVAGLAWSFALMAAFSAALAAGRARGQEGLLTGILFSTLAAAAIARLAIISSGAQGYKYMEDVPFIAWALAAFLMAMIAFPEKGKSASGS